MTDGREDFGRQSPPFAVLRQRDGGRGGKLRVDFPLDMGF